MAKKTLSTTFKKQFFSLKVWFFIFHQIQPNHMWGPPKNFNQFSAIFGHFYPFSFDNFPLTPKPDLRNLPKNRFWPLLVNNQLCSIPLSWATPDINIMAGESCGWLVLWSENDHLRDYFVIFSVKLQCSDRLQTDHDGHGPSRMGLLSHTITEGLLRGQWTDKVRQNNCAVYPLLI